MCNHWETSKTRRWAHISCFARKSHDFSLFICTVSSGHHMTKWLVCEQCLANITALCAVYAVSHSTEILPPNYRRNNINVYFFGIGYRKTLICLRSRQSSNDAITCNENKLDFGLIVITGHCATVCAACCNFVILDWTRSDRIEDAMKSGPIATCMETTLVATVYAHNAFLGYLRTIGCPPKSPISIGRSEFHGLLTAFSLFHSANSVANYRRPCVDTHSEWQCSGFTTRQHCG